MWKIIYHPDTKRDLRLLGSVEARHILRVMHERIAQGEPDKIGKPLSRSLAGYRRIRVRQTRIVYRVNKKEIEIFVIAIGVRRDDLVYLAAQKRTQGLK